MSIGGGWGREGPGCEGKEGAAGGAKGVEVYGIGGSKEALYPDVGGTGAWGGRIDWSVMLIASVNLCSGMTMNGQ